MVNTIFFAVIFINAVQQSAGLKLNSAVSKPPPITLPSKLQQPERAFSRADSELSAATTPRMNQQTCNCQAPNLPTMDQAKADPRQYFCKNCNKRPQLEMHLASLVVDTQSHKARDYDARVHGNSYLALTFPWGTIALSALTPDLFSNKVNKFDETDHIQNAKQKIETSAPKPDVHGDEIYFTSDRFEVLQMAFKSKLPRGGDGNLTIHAPSAVKQVLLDHIAIHEEVVTSNTTPAHILKVEEKIGKYFGYCGRRNFRKIVYRP